MKPWGYLLSFLLVFLGAAISFAEDQCTAKAGPQEAPAFLSTEYVCEASTTCPSWHGRPPYVSSCQGTFSCSSEEGHWVECDGFYTCCFPLC